MSCGTISNSLWSIICNRTNIELTFTICSHIYDHFTQFNAESAFCDHAGSADGPYKITHDFYLFI